MRRPPRPAWGRAASSPRRRSRRPPPSACRRSGGCPKSRSGFIDCSSGSRRRGAPRRASSARSRGSHRRSSPSGSVGNFGPGRGPTCRLHHLDALHAALSGVLPDGRVRALARDRRLGAAGRRRAARVLGKSGLCAFLCRATRRGDGSGPSGNSSPRAAAATGTMPGPRLPRVAVDVALGVGDHAGALWSYESRQPPRDRHTREERRAEVQRGRVALARVARAVRVLVRLVATRVRLQPCPARVWPSRGPWRLLQVLLRGGGVRAASSADTPPCAICWCFHSSCRATIEEVACTRSGARGFVGRVTRAWR